MPTRVGRGDAELEALLLNVAEAGTLRVGLWDASALGLPDRVAVTGAEKVKEVEEVDEKRLLAVPEVDAAGVPVA